MWILLGVSKLLATRRNTYAAPPYLASPHPLRDVLSAVQ